MSSRRGSRSPWWCLERQTTARVERATIDMKLEIVVISVSDVDRAK
jgi:hypothetical protein